MLEPPYAPTFDDLADGADVVTLAVVNPLVRAPRRHPEATDLELPGSIWRAMGACYGLFFAGLIAATGHDLEAGFALVVSIGYSAMYFGTAGILFGLNRPEHLTDFARGRGELQTWTGAMNRSAVAAQVLAVPACLAFFGIAIAIIRFAVIG